jgi:hypothetical protein
VHVGAHPLHLAARAPTHGDVHILARSPPAATDSGQPEANGHSPTNGLPPTNGHSPTNGPPRSHDHQIYRPFGGLKLGISLYYDQDVTYTEEDKQTWLQSIFEILTGAYGEVVQGPRAQENTLIQSLKAHALGLNTTMQSYRDYSGQPEASGQARDGHGTNGHATNGNTNGHTNGNSPGRNGPTQTSYMDPVRVRGVISSHHAEGAVAAKGKHFQDLLSILTSGEVPRNGVEREQNLLHSLKNHGMGFKDTMHKVHEYDQEFRRASFAASLVLRFNNVLNTT